MRWRGYAAAGRAAAHHEAPPAPPCRWVVHNPTYPCRWPVLQLSHETLASCRSGRNTDALVLTLDFVKQACWTWQHVGTAATVLGTSSSLLWMLDNVVA